MSRPVGGKKRRAWRLKKKHDRWFRILTFDIFRQTLKTISDGAPMLRCFAYRKYDLFNVFYNTTAKEKRNVAFRKSKNISVGKSIG